jgi:hypothetical protein
MTRLGNAVSKAVADERRLILDFLAKRAADLRDAGDDVAARTVLILAADIKDAKHRAPIGEQSVPCCCAWGAAVAGEYPEFGCYRCPVHQAGVGELPNELCRRHARETRGELADRVEKVIASSRVVQHGVTYEKRRPHDRPRR